MKPLLQNCRQWANQNRIKFGVGVLVLVVTLWQLFFSDHSSSGKSEKVESVRFVLAPPPPPPPPPPPQDTKTPDKPKMLDDSKPITPEEKPPESAGAVTLGAGDSFGLNSGSGNGMGNGDGGSRFGWYAGLVVNSVKDALAANPKTKSNHGHVQAKLWVDLTGRITRVVLVNSSGDPNVDRAMQDEVLTGLTLPSPPSADMPMPITIEMTR